MKLQWTFGLQHRLHGDGLECGRRQLHRQPIDDRHGNRGSYRSGTYTYTLSCTGMGGNASVTTPAVTVSPSIFTTLSTAGTITTIGSTVDPMNGDQNPYGLAIAPATAGLITKRKRHDSRFKAR